MDKIDTNNAEATAKAIDQTTTAKANAGASETAGAKCYSIKKGKITLCGHEFDKDEFVKAIGNAERDAWLTLELVPTAEQMARNNELLLKARAGEVDYYGEWSPVITLHEYTARFTCDEPFDKVTFVCKDTAGVEHTIRITDMACDDQDEAGEGKAVLICEYAVDGEAFTERHGCNWNLFGETDIIVPAAGNIPADMSSLRFGVWHLLMVRNAKLTLELARLGFDTGWDAVKSLDSLVIGNLIAPSVVADREEGWSNFLAGEFFDNRLSQQF